MNGKSHIKFRKKLTLMPAVKLEQMGLNYDGVEAEKKGSMHKTYIRPKLTYGLDNFALNSA